MTHFYRMAASVLVSLGALSFGPGAVAHADDPLLPYGPDTCIDGYVWREITHVDHVCVTPETREAFRIRGDADLHRDLNHPDQPLCEEGYVPRRFTYTDVACATPQQMEQIASDNAQAENRKAINHLPRLKRVKFGPQELIGRCTRMAKGSGCNHIFIIRNPNGPVREPVTVDWLSRNCRGAPADGCGDLFIEMTPQEWDDGSP